MTNNVFILKLHSLVEMMMSRLSYAHKNEWAAFAFWPLPLDPLTAEAKRGVLWREAT
jgi:hypothetical protein